jgi:hypothetical protein
LRSSLDLPKAIDLRVHGQGIFSLTSMVITHLAVDDSVLVQLALTLNPCSNLVEIGSDRKIFGDLCSHIRQRSPNFRELDGSSALAARTRKVDSNVRALLNFNSDTYRTFRMFVEKYFLY